MARAGYRRGGSSRRAPQVQVDPAALKLELVDLALAEVLATGLEGEDLQVARQMLELGQQFSYSHLTQRSAPCAVCGLALGATGLIGPSGNRAWNRAWCACAVCAPPTVEPRTPRTPL